MIKRRRSTLHEWINSIGVVLAIILSANSVDIARQNSLLKMDNLAGSSFPTGDCQFIMSQKGDPNDGRNRLTMCWRINIANTSEGRLTVKDIGVSGGVPGPYLPDQNVDDSRLEIPFGLAGGDAKSFIIHRPVAISDKIADFVLGIPGIKPDAVAPMRLSAVENLLNKNGLDLLGNHVAIHPLFLAYRPIGDGPEKTVSDQIIICTARGPCFAVNLHYPYELEETKLFRIK
jgi:hypothetical protein